MTVSLCMIVKNEAANLEACIAPVRDLVDEIVVVDTGSTDETRVIAERLGARVFDFPWCDSFSAARNQAIEHAKGDWVLILDADDRVVPPEKEKLRKLFANLDAENVGWMMGGVCLTADGGVSTEVEQVRLFQNRPEHRFRYRVHEQIIPSIVETAGRFVHSGIRLVHVGYRDSKAVDGKIARNLRLVELDCAERPSDPFPNFYRGVMLSELGRHAEAIVTLELCRARVCGDSAMYRSLSYALARAQCEEDDIPGALETIRAGRRAQPNDAALACVEAEILVATGDVAGAAAAIVELASREQRDLTTQDLRIRALFAEILLVLGHVEAAEQAATDLVERRPAFGLPWLVLADALLAQRKYSEIDALLANLGRIRNTEIACAIIRAARTAFQRAPSNAIEEIDPSRDLVLAALSERLATMKDATTPLASCLGAPWSTAQDKRKETTNAHVHLAGLLHHPRKLGNDDHAERIGLVGSHAVSRPGFLGGHARAHWHDGYSAAADKSYER